MPRHPDDAIDVGCPRCQAGLWAGTSQVGRRLRCPFCQFVLHVPGAAPNQVGETLACADCDTVVEARAPVPPRRPLRPAGPLEDDPLWGVSQPPDGKAMQQTYVPVVCTACQTRMLATDDEVGRAITCPDCGTAAVVRPLRLPAARPSMPVPAHDAEPANGIVAGSSEWGPDSATHGTQFPLLCPQCQTRLHAVPEHLGRELTCPDCGAPIREHAPDPAMAAFDPMADADAGYSVAPPIDLPQWKPVFESSEVEAGAGQREGDVTRPADRGPLRSSTFRPPGATVGQWWRGIAGFPLKQSVWPRWLVLSGGILPVLWLAETAIRLGSVPSIGHWIVGLVVSGLAGMGAILWLTVFGAWAVVIVVDTAAGADSIENWPDGPYQDWFPDVFYVLNALAVGAMPGAAAGWLLARPGLPTGPWLGTSIFVMFPVVLLSMFEWGSALRPLSAKLLASMLQRWWSWLVFYAVATALLMSAVALAWLAVWGLGRLGSVPAVGILVGALLVYFRLLGRLGMICGGRIATAG